MNSLRSYFDYANRSNEEEYHFKNKKWKKNFIQAITGQINGVKLIHSIKIQTEFRVVNSDGGNH